MHFIVTGQDFCDDYASMWGRNGGASTASASALHAMQLRLDSTDNDSGRETERKGGGVGVVGAFTVQTLRNASEQNRTAGKGCREDL